MVQVQVVLVVQVVNDWVVFDVRIAVVNIVEVAPIAVLVLVEQNVLKGVLLILRL